MRYVIVESHDPSEVNKWFEADIPPRIGVTIRFSGTHEYRVVDVEYLRHRFTEMPVLRGLLQRLPN